MNIKSFINALSSKKSIDAVLEGAKKSDLKKTLSAFDLFILGMGAVVGTGILTIVGVAAAGGPENVGAGPALVVSMLLAALCCVFTALCYSEFAAMIPATGSAYLYTYVTMGEFVAWVVGWILMLEYAIGNITVASAWTGYFLEFLKGFAHILPPWLVNPPIWLVNDYISAVEYCKKNGLNPEVEIPRLFDFIPICINVPAIFILLLVTLLLVRGIKESTKAAAVMVAIKLAIILLFIAVGAFYVRPENWTPFAPGGFKGVFMGAFIIFFAYVGFDAISTAAEETKKPQRDLPLGLMGTLIGCTVLYVLVALVLTGMVPTPQIDIHAPLAHAMRAVNQDWVAGLISLGALMGLSSVILVYQLGTTRILFAMSRDKFLPSSFQKIHPKHKTPHIITWASFVLVALGCLFMDINISAELCNFGTFASFIIICIAVLILRKKDPDRYRPFRVPWVPLVPILGILCCSALMIYSLKHLAVSSKLFPLWVVLGIVIYFLYGYRMRRRAEKE
ncbi:basic amino acid/polyamine antiporter, APA family [Candidatus Gastranaerophilus sp. (ex Termes propinquus)]|nr:basic amino acid/polyamine antiporter, APA family [Candidatus Gastranaerophilus sp. (ex Termes propinquus)]